MRILPVIALILSLPSACAGDETVSGYADPDAVYVLEEIDGTLFAARATITFPEEGRAAGEAPCNQWTAEQKAPYPWLELGPIAVTRRACPDLAAETVFLDTLAAMRLVEAQGAVLILSEDESKREMVFRAAQD